MTATFSQRAVEAAAEAICCKAHKLGCAATHSGSPFTACQAHTYRDDALNALTAALAVDGVALVPKEPTQAMIIAGCENNPTQWDEGTDDGFAADVANDVYRAMLAAASEGEERR